MMDPSGVFLKDIANHAISVLAYSEAGQGLEVKSTCQPGLSVTVPGGVLTLSVGPKAQGALPIASTSTFVPVLKLLPLSGTPSCLQYLLLLKAYLPTFQGALHMLLSRELF